MDARPPGQAAATGRAVPAIPWWVVGVLVVGALSLVAMNWPGAVESRKIWTDEDQTGWRVFRAWDDSLILASFVALVAALLARSAGRRAPLALGVVAGCAATVAEDGVLILGARIEGEEAGVWVAATVVSAAMVAVVAVVLRPPRWAVLPVGPVEAVLVVAGGMLLLASAAVRHDDGVSFFTVTPLAALDPLVAVALAWPALAAVEASARMWLGATAATYSLLSAFAALAALADGSAAAFLAALGGSLLIVAGVVLATRRPLEPAGPAQPTPATRWLRSHPALIAVAAAVAAILLALVNLAGLEVDLRLWSNSNFGSPDLGRHLGDGTLTAAVVMLAGAAVGWRRGRLGAYGVGVAAGAAALVATAAVVILGGRIWYDSVDVWSISLAIAAVLLALVLAGTARSTEYRRPTPVTGVVLAVGFVVLLVVQLVSDESGPAAVTYTHGLAVLLPIVAAALVLLATTTGNPVAVGAAASYLVLFGTAAVYPISVDVAPVYFGVMLAGHAVVLAALVLGLRQTGSRTA